MKLTFRLPLLLAFALCSPAAALASDMGVPDFRPSTFDVYVGGYAASNVVRSSYVEDDTFSGDLDGTGYGGGMRLGVDYGTESWVVGLVGDWTFGGPIADEQGVEFKMPNLGTIRARAGGRVGDALIYATGGLASAEMEMKVDVEDFSQRESDWNWGWTIGAGIDYALTDSISMGLEYLYVSVGDYEYEVEDDVGTTYTFEHDIEGIHSFRLGFNYAFHI